MPDSHEAQDGRDRQGDGRKLRPSSAVDRTASKGPDARRADSLLSGVLAIAGLSSLAFAQPLYDLLRRSPEFFAIRDLYMGDLLALVAGLLVGPTLAFSAPGIVARFLRPSWTRWAIAPPIGLLAALIALQAVNGLAAAGALGVALMVWLGASWAYVRLKEVRSFALLLCGAAVVVPALLLLDGDVRRSATAPTPAVGIDAPDTGARAPIVLVIFDEWSLTSILDRTGAIDRERLPNLAALADRATWYPNATAAADVSELALPAMLTGSTPARGQLPTAAEHPVNLFTLLAPSHDIHAVEPITSLSPPQINLLAASRPPASQRFSLLMSDLSLVWLDLTLPSRWSDRLPAVTRSWSGFGRSVGGTPVPPPTDQPVARALFHLNRTDRAAEFRRFVEAIQPSNERPDLYFLHSMLPHLPWEYLPSGRRYERSGRPHGLEGEIWHTDPWPALHHQKRYLLQVEFVDRLLGELVAKLRSTGLLDSSVIAVTADHGVAFQPGRSRRLLELTDLGGGQPLDLASVPLLIKAPFQKAPEINDAPVSLVGLAARILELAGADPDAVPLAGALFGTPTIVGKYAGRVEIGAHREAWRHHRLAEQARLLTPSNDPISIGVRPELHGRPVSDFVVRDNDLAIEFEDAWAWDHVDLDTNIVPVAVAGVFKRRQPPSDRNIAVALNGVIAATIRPHRGADGSVRITAMLPENDLRAGLNQLDVFLVRESQGGTELEHIRRPPYPVYAISRNARGQVDALVRGSRHSLNGPAKRIPVVRSDPNGLYGNLDGSVEGIAFQGWALDQGDPGGVEEAVAFLAGRQIAVSGVRGSRPDVAEHHGTEHLHSGFLLRPAPETPFDRRFGAGESLAETVHREGVVAYAVSRRGIATRLRFSYLPIERRGRGVETLPTTDGRQLALQAPGDGVDGSLDVVATRGEATIIEGWAADLERGERPRQIVVYRDGRFLVSLGTSQERPDVERHHGDDRLLRTGFRGAVPGAPDPATFGDRHRVFAILLRGVALELPTLSASTTNP